MEGGGRSGRLRSFALGSLVGAAGAIATRDRLSRARALRDTPGGLEAFEGAPCFQERLADESPGYRDGAEPVSGGSTEE